MTRSDDLPEKWPVITAADLCVDTLYDGEGRRCLLGWCAVVAPVAWSEGRAKAKDAVQLALRETLPSNARSHTVSYNDGQDLELVARVWNRAGALLGYEHEGLEQERLPQEAKWW